MFRTRHRPIERAAARGAVLALCFVLLDGSGARTGAVAGERTAPRTERTLSEASREPESERAAEPFGAPRHDFAESSAEALFYTGHFLPRVSRQLGPMHAMAYDPRILGLDDAAASDAERAVRRGVERATRKAIRDYLLETTSLERKFELWHRGSRDAGGGSGDPDAVNRPSLQFGFRGIRPELELRHDLGQHAYGLRIDAGGDVRLTYRHGRTQNVALDAGFDSDEDTYRLDFRLGF